MGKSITKIVMIAIALVSGGIGIVYAFPQDKIIGLLILGATVIVSAAIATYPDLVSIKLVRTNRQVSSAVRELAQKSTRLWFCGRANQEILRELVENFKKRKNTDGSSYSVSILNCDPNFYVSSDPELCSDMLKLDAKYPDDVFSHKFHFYRQNVSYLIGESDGKKRVIFLIRSAGGDWNGIYIRRGLTIEQRGLVIEKACPSINIRKQIKNIQDVAAKTLEFWEPLQNGWFQPVFPPDSNPVVRAAWRDAILDWFSSEATHYLNDGGELRITWKIMNRSEKDARRFAQWLGKLKKGTCPGMKVVRYMLISKRLYNTDSSYKALVDKIVSDYLPTLPRNQDDPYLVYFLNSDSLPESLNNDFALFVQPNGERIAQDALREEKEGVELLSVYFTKNFEKVEEIRDKFRNLDRYHPKVILKDIVE